MNERKNAEGYSDPTAYEAIRHEEEQQKEEARQKAFYVFQTIFSVARLAGYQVIGDIKLTDWAGREHDSSEIMPRYKHRKDV